jgi:hypothetical protein
VHRPLPGLTLFSFAPTDLPTLLRLRQEDENLLSVAAVARLLACLRTPCFVENYKKYDVSPTAREVHVIRHLDITG